MTAMVRRNPTLTATMAGLESMRLRPCEMAASEPPASAHCSRAASVISIPGLHLRGGHEVEGGLGVEISLKSGVWEATSRASFMRGSASSAPLGRRAISI